MMTLREKIALQFGELFIANVELADKAERLQAELDKQNEPDPTKSSNSGYSGNAKPEKPASSPQRQR